MSATETKGKALITGALLSSKPAFQRLSKAALSRSGFLRLAAGALLPFVGGGRQAQAETFDWFRHKAQARMRGRVGRRKIQHSRIQQGIKCLIDHR
jgi:hypothetical protein